MIAREKDRAWRLDLWWLAISWALTVGSLLLMAFR